jgi:hypothetical protein
VFQTLRLHFTPDRKFHTECIGTFPSSFTRLGPFRLPSDLIQINKVNLIQLLSNVDIVDVLKFRNMLTRPPLA